MSRSVRIWFGDMAVEAELNASRTAQAIWDALPIEGRGNRWGKEIYFPIAVRLDEEDAKAVVEKGDLAYWPQGPALCVFWGPTPASRGDECRSYSPVNVFGRLKGDPQLLDGVRDLNVRMEKAP
jgi:hypothetical protein